MSLVVGTNSWASLTEANIFLSDWYGASAWASLTNTNKESLLITAFWRIYKNGKYSIAKSETNEDVKNAQILTAFYIYENNDEVKQRLASQAQGVENFSISSFSEKYSKGSWLPIEVEGMLEDWINWDVFAEFDRELD